MPPITVSPAHLRTILFVVGLLSILLSLFWPRDDDGYPRKGRFALFLGLILGIAAIGPGRALEKKKEELVVAQQLQENDKCRDLEQDFRKTELELQRATTELESLKNSASLERRIDADREASDHQALMDMATDLKRSGHVLKLYFDESRSGLTFASGRKDLTCDAKEKLARIAIYLREERDLQKITIVGHTDNTPRTGDPSFNQRLSEARANEVVAYLQKAGVPNMLLTSRGAADRQPAGFDSDQSQEKINEHNSTEPQKALNRRVEIDIQTKG